MNCRRERTRPLLWLILILSAVLSGCATPVALPPEDAIASIVEDTRQGRIDACRDPRWIAWRREHGEQGTARLTILRDQAKARSEALEPPPPDVNPYEWSDQRARLDGLLHIVRAALAATNEPQWYSMLAEQEEKSDRSELLAEGLKALNERERHILTARRLKDEPATLEDLSKEFDISRERVRQIEVRAFEKLQRAIRDAAKLSRTGGGPAAKAKEPAALPAR